MSSYIKNMAEYEALRAEINARISINASMWSSIGTYVLTIMLVNISLLIGVIILEEPLDFCIYFTCNIALAIFFLSFSISLARKYEENMQQIFMISSYLRIFYEENDTQLQWESIQNDPNFKNILKAGKEEFLYNFEYIAVPLSAVLGYGINCLFMFRRYTECHEFWLLIIGSIAVALLSFFILRYIREKINIKSFSEKYGEYYSKEFEAMHKNEK